MRVEIRSAIKPFALAAIIAVLVGCGGPATEGSLELTAIPTAPLDARTDASLVWTGRELIDWGGSIAQGGPAPIGAAPAGAGAIFDRSASAWRATSAATVTGRSAHAAAWTGDRMVVRGGA